MFKWSFLPWISLTPVGCWLLSIDRVRWCPLHFSIEYTTPVEYTTPLVGCWDLIGWDNVLNRGCHVCHHFWHPPAHTNKGLRLFVCSIFIIMHYAARGGVVAWWALCAVQSRWIICSMVNSQALHATVCISNQQFLTITNYSHCNISPYLVLKLIQQKTCCEFPFFGNFKDTLKLHEEDGKRKSGRTQRRWLLWLNQQFRNHATFFFAPFLAKHRRSPYLIFVHLEYTTALWRRLKSWPKDLAWFGKSTAQPVLAVLTNNSHNILSGHPLQFFLNNSKKIKEKMKMATYINFRHIWRIFVIDSMNRQKVNIVQQK